MLAYFRAAVKRQEVRSAPERTADSDAGVPALKIDGLGSVGGADIAFSVGATGRIHTRQCMRHPNAFSWFLGARQPTGMRDCFEIGHPGRRAAPWGGLAGASPGPTGGISRFLGALRPKDTSDRSRTL